MKKLTEVLTFDTGLVHNGSPITISLRPNENGGDLILHNGAKSKTIALKQVVSNMVEAKPNDVCAADWVELGALETEIMVDGECPLIAKGHLFRIARKTRNERRADRGLPPVVWGTLRTH